MDTTDARSGIVLYWKYFSRHTCKPSKALFRYSSNSRSSTPYTRPLHRECRNAKLGCRNGVRKCRGVWKKINIFCFITISKLRPGGFFIKNLWLFAQATVVFIASISLYYKGYLFTITNTETAKCASLAYYRL